jgi:hypothetical protein
VIAIGSEFDDGAPRLRKSARAIGAVIVAIATASAEMMRSLFS